MPSTHTTQRPCPICDGHQAEVLHRQRFALFDDHQLGAEYSVVVCCDCGFGFADTAAAQVQYDTLYARLSRYSAAGTTTLAVNPLDRLRFQQIADEIVRAVPNRSARIVDIGCANGQLLKALADAGYSQLCGVDPSPACVQQTALVPGVTARVGSLLAMPEGVPPYDVVVLSHVMEHVRDARLSLDTLRSHLAADAVLYVEVPDAARYCDFIVAPFQDFNTEHINHFTKPSLGNLLRRCGFTPFRSAPKEIFSAPSMPYPAVFCLAATDDRSDPTLEADSSLRERLVAYIERSAQLLQAINGHLRGALDREPEVVVWGTGELLAKLLADTVLSTTHVMAFVDSNPVNHGRMVRGQPVVSPDGICSSDRPIVVASLLHADSIVRTIRAHGLTNPIVTLQ